MSRFAALKVLPLFAVIALASAPVSAQSTDPHHDDTAPQTPPSPMQGLPSPVMPGPGMAGPMMMNPGANGAQGSGMGTMMQMMQMMQSSQMMQMAQMMQMMQMMQAMQSGAPGAGMGMQNGPNVMSGGMPSGLPVGGIEPLIADYKTALAITEAQMPQWNAFADALRAGAKQIEQARGDTPSGTTGPAAAPAQLERHATLLQVELAAIRQSQASLAALYDVLSAKQKRAADLLMADHLSRM